MSSTLYKKLETKSKQIRLIHLHRGGSQGLICCSLRTVALAKDPVYEALSYVWGDPSVTAPIVVDGQTIEVTVNLESALRHLRLSNCQRTIWVDAICVNQQDLEERSDQVVLMRDIYSQAVGVVGWLGPETEYSAEAIGLLHMLAAGTHSDKMSTFNPKLAAELEPHRPPRTETLRPLRELCQNPWFLRIWIAQEVALASSLHLQIGHGKVKWEIVFDAIDWLSRSCDFWNTLHAKTPLEETSALISTIMGTISAFLIVRASVGDSSTAGSYSILRLYRYLRCSDDRDKIYGLLALTSGFAIRPDYTLPVEEVYQRAAFAAMIQSGTLEVLRAASFTEQKYALPSWVPDWSVREILGSRSTYITYGYQKHFSACRDLRAEPRYSKSGELVLQGVSIGTIIRTTDVCQDKADSNEPRRPLPSLLSKAKRDLSMLMDTAGIESEEFMLRVLVGDTIRDSVAQTVRRPLARDLDISLNTFEQIISSEYRPDDNMHRFIKAMAVAQYYRRLFSTNKNQIGIGPSTISSGDLICVLNGGEKPFVLRRCKPDTHSDDSLVNRYQLVGEAYVYGIMDGEAVTDIVNGTAELEDFHLV
ncbi:hypothetical protein MMC18_007272 [Xylographa bjoerkii]|nr:hypothetical protein [Xylographa bjoerkii]